MKNFFYLIVTLVLFTSCTATRKSFPGSTSPAIIRCLALEAPGRWTDRAPSGTIGTAGRAEGEAGAMDRVVYSEASQATEADRRAIEFWASARPEIDAVRLGPIVDLEDAA